MLGNFSPRSSALQGLGFGQYDTGIPRMSRIPIQSRPGAPSADGEDVDGFLEVPDDGYFDDMTADGDFDDEGYGVAPRVLKSSFIEDFGQTSAQPLTRRDPVGADPMGGQMADPMADPMGLPQDDGSMALQNILKKRRGGSAMAGLGY